MHSSPLVITARGRNLRKKMAEKQNKIRTLATRLANDVAPLKRKQVADLPAAVYVELHARLRWGIEFRRAVRAVEGVESGASAILDTGILKLCLLRRGIGLLNRLHHLHATGIE